MSDEKWKVRVGKEGGLTKRKCVRFVDFYCITLCTPYAGYNETIRLIYFYLCQANNFTFPYDNLINAERYRSARSFQNGFKICVCCELLFKHPANKIFKLLGSPVFFRANANSLNHICFVPI